MGDTSSIWGGIISGLVSAYGQKKAKDKAQDQYKYQQQEIERQRQYAEEMYQRRQNTPSARASSYLMEYYLPQVVDKMKKHSKGGDTSVLDRMLADIMGGIRHNSDGSSYGDGQGGSDPFFTSGSLSSESAKRSGIAYSRGKGYLGDSGEFFATPEAAMNSNRKGGASYSMGRLDPEIEGYNGKSWSGERYGSVDGDPFAREQTHGMGNVTTQTERGYSVQHQPWNMIDEGSDIAIPNQQGSLATGGTLNVATEGMDPSKLLAFGSMLGISKGPKGTSMTPGGSYGNGKFEMSDIMDWARSHPVLWSMAKGIGNTILPGAPMLATAALNFRDRRAARRNQQPQPEGRGT